MTHNLSKSLTNDNQISRVNKTKLYLATHIASSQPITPLFFKQKQTAPSLLASPSSSDHNKSSYATAYMTMHMHAKDNCQAGAANFIAHNRPSELQVVLGCPLPVLGSPARHADVVSLGLGELGQLGTKLAQVESSNLLIKVLGEHIHLLLVLARAPLLPQLKLGNDLHQE